MGAATAAARADSMVVETVAMVVEAAMVEEVAKERRGLATGNALSAAPMSSHPSRSASSVGQQRIPVGVAAGAVAVTTAAETTAAGIATMTAVGEFIV